MGSQMLPRRSRGEPALFDCQTARHDEGRQVNKYEHLCVEVRRAAEALFAEFGPESAVIVMVGVQDHKTHSAYAEETRGRCLPVEGLLVRASSDIRKALWRNSPKIYASKRKKRSDGDLVR